MLKLLECFAGDLQREADDDKKSGGGGSGGGGGEEEDLEVLESLRTT